MNEMGKETVRYENNSRNAKENLTLNDAARKK